MYLIVWLLLLSGDSIAHDIKKSYYSNLTHEYWASYISVEPTKPVFTNGEKLEFTSTVQHVRTSRFGWLDVIRCDTNKDGFFSYYSDYRSGPVERTVYEPSTVSNEWYYGDARTSYPPIGIDCIIESHITYTPKELEITDDSDRVQIITSQSTFQVQ